MNRKGFAPILLLVGVFVFILIVGGTYYLGTKNNKLQTQNSPIVSTLATPSQPVTNSASNSNIKEGTYTNSFYNFKLDLPSGWTTQEGTRSDSFPIAEIASPNKEIIIYVNYDFGATHIDQELPHQPDVQLGQYKVYRSRYISGGKTVDYINLYNVPDQKTLLLTFNISRDFDKNNATLLKILNTFAFTQKELGTTSYFTYTLAPGWKLEHDDYQAASFTSSDYQTDEHVGYTVRGVHMSVTRNIMQPNKTLQDVVNQFPDKQTNDTKPVQIDGISGLVRHSNWESHAQVFLVVKDNYLWQISATTASLDDENKHRQEIDSFIASVKLK